jgi:DNA-binding transcriptional LysR family regulator
MQITLRQLEIFAAVSQEGSVTGAANRIGLSQAATSQALAELENQLRYRLFDRNGRRLKQNAAGRELLPDAIAVIDRARDIERGARSSSFEVRLCASLTVGNYMLPPLIGRFARRFPGACFQMAVGNTDHVVTAVRQLESDVGWVEGIASDPQLHSFPWREDRLVIIAAPGHPLAGRKATAQALADASWVLREKGSGTREVFEQAIAGRFSLGHIPLELGSIGAVKRAVGAGAGLSCISRSTIDLELKAGQLALVHTPGSIFDVRLLCSFIGGNTSTGACAVFCISVVCGPQCEFGVNMASPGGFEPPLPP